MAKASFKFTSKAAGQAKAFDHQVTFECKVNDRGNNNATDYYQDHIHQIAIWGDPATTQSHSQIVSNILNRDYQSYYGSSWVCYNRQTQTLIGATDRIGVFPVHHLERDGSHLLASSRRELQSCVQAPLSLNPEALIQILAFGQVLNDSSALSGVTHFAPGTLFSINPEGRLESKQVQKSPIFCSEETKFDDAVDAFVAAVDNSLRHSPGAILSLSGGLDSRLILAAALSSGKKFIGLSYGGANSADIQIAKDLADAASVPLFTSHDIGKESIWRTSQRIADHGMGEVALHHAHALMDENLVQQTKGRTIITGTGAETYRAFYYDRGLPGFSLFGSRYLNKRFMPHARRYIGEEFGKTSNVVKMALPQLADQIDMLLQKSIADAESTEMSAAEFLDNYYLTVRVPRMVAAGQQLLDEFYERSHPFLDKDVIYYASNLPASTKLGSEFHRKAIEKLSPKLASITWDKTAEPLNAGMTLNTRYPALASKIGLKPSWGKRSVGILDYAKVLGHVDNSIVTETLIYLGLADSEANKAAKHLLNSSIATHVKGFSIVWSHFLQNLMANLDGESFKGEYA